MKLLFLLLISYVIFPVYLPNVLFGAEQEGFYSCCLVCQHDPCICTSVFDGMIVAPEIPSTDVQQPMQGRRYQCTYPGCVYATAYSSHLTNHERIHTEERPYKCQHPGCKYAAAQSTHLTNHKRIHTGEKPYTCTWNGCKRAFTQSSHLTTHMRIHTGERPHKCPHPDCEYAATRSDELTSHKRIHTGEKPYTCSFCGYIFAHRKSLVQHQKTYHTLSGGNMDRPPKRTQKNLDNDEAGAPEDQEAKRVHRGDL